MRVHPRAAVAAGLAAMLVGPSAAFAREWGPAQPLGVDESTFLVHSAPVGLGETVSVYQRVVDGRSQVVTRSAMFGAPFGEAQVLGAGRSFYPKLVTDALGEAIAAWYSETDEAVMIAIRPPGGTFGAPRTLPESPSDYSEGAPVVATSPGGNAVVVFLQRGSQGQRLVASYRPAGGDFGPAEAVAPTAGAGRQIARSAAVSDGGEVVVGYVQDEAAHAVTRAAGVGGAWRAARRLGPTGSEFSWRLPQVGIDATGGAVVIWKEGLGASAESIGALRAAFRVPGGDFGGSQDLGVDAYDEGPTMATSALGESILVARPALPLDGGGAALKPLVALSGSTLLGRFGAPRAISERWFQSDPLVAMNARGDAVLTVDECCPMRIVARRRAPLGGFGPEEDVVAPLSFDGTRGGRIVRDLQLDAFGNAAVTWVDFEPRPAPLLVSRDGPRLDTAADIVAPGQPQLAELVPAPAPPPDLSGLPPLPGGRAPVVGGLPPAPRGLPPLAALPPAALPAGARLPPTVAGPPAAPGTTLSVDVVRAPRMTGAPRAAVTVRCSAACAVSLKGVISQPSGRALRLPEVTAALDRPATVGLYLPLTATATRALRVRPPAQRARRRSVRPRAFTLRVAATARDARGQVLKDKTTRRFRRR